MASGIYKLTFGEGQYLYIGKSVDIDKRWQQHYDKLLKGTAAKNMQEAYNNYGLPDTEVLIECHPDHIDVLEPLYISAYMSSHPGRCLNSAIPEVYTNITEEMLNCVNHKDELFNIGTFDHILEVKRLRKALDKRNAKVGKLENEINALFGSLEQAKQYHLNYLKTIDLNEEGEHWRRSYFESLEVRTLREKELQAQITHLETINQQIGNLLNKERKKTWWQKLWE